MMQITEWCRTCYFLSCNLRTKLCFPQDATFIDNFATISAWLSFEDGVYQVTTNIIVIFGGKVRFYLSGEMFKIGHEFATWLQGASLSTKHISPPLFLLIPVSWPIHPRLTFKGIRSAQFSRGQSAIKNCFSHGRRPLRRNLNSKSHHQLS